LMSLARMVARTRGASGALCWAVMASVASGSAATRGEATKIDRAEHEGAQREKPPPTVEAVLANPVCASPVACSCVLLLGAAGGGLGLAEQLAATLPLPSGRRLRLDWLLTMVRGRYCRAALRGWAAAAACRVVLRAGKARAFRVRRDAPRRRAWRALRAWQCWSVRRRRRHWWMPAALELAERVRGAGRGARLGWALRRWRVSLRAGVAARAHLDRVLGHGGGGHTGRRRQQRLETGAAAAATLLAAVVRDLRSQAVARGVAAAGGSYVPPPPPAYHAAVGGAPHRAQTQEAGQEGAAMSLGPGLLEQMRVEHAELLGRVLDLQREAARQVSSR
jgi:hypothetical protein